MTKEEYKTLFERPHPDTLEECLKILEKIKYKSAGFPHVFLNYDYTLKKEWSVCFRNPINFSNEFGGDKDPVIACHIAFDYLRLRLMSESV